MRVTRVKAAGVALVVLAALGSAVWFSGPGVVAQGRKACERCQAEVGDTVPGVRVFKSIDVEGREVWGVDEVEVAGTGCHTSCGAVIATPAQDPTLPPTVQCPGDNCHLNQRANEDGSITYWCCGDEEQGGENAKVKQNHDVTLSR
jgi:hypothetical protein